MILRVSKIEKHFNDQNFNLNPDALKFAFHLIKINRDLLLALKHSNCSQNRFTNNPLCPSDDNARNTACLLHESIFEETNLKVADLDRTSAHRLDIQANEESQLDSYLLVLLAFNYFGNEIGSKKLNYLFCLATDSLLVVFKKIKFLHCFEQKNKILN